MRRATRFKATGSVPIESGNVLTNAIVIGVYINSAGDNTVGGGTSEAGNTIMGYTDYGVYLFGSQSTGNVIQGNQIGQQGGKQRVSGEARQRNS